ncbi:hypothetical protein [Streptomyces sp. NPDC006309]|uniref:hypothetical protein n=1 Tax=Streptomyces sp. NPDC006309 TaxID=3156749 RepID=UPI0033BE5396
MIVYPPSETGGPGVRINDQILGTAYQPSRPHSVRRPDRLDGPDVAESGLIEWHEGGPEAWEG